MSHRKILAVCAVIIALAVILVLISAACGHKRGQVTQLSLMPLAQHEQDDSEQTGDDGGVLPPVMALDGCIAVTRGVSEDETVTSPGWEAYVNEQTGTNGTSGLNVEMEGTALTLRAYAPGEYAYAVYGQTIVGTPKPLHTQIKSEVCAFGGGQDDDIPLSYFVGIADYSIGSWRWFGPFGEEDVIVTVNSETLRSRFKSPNGNFYLCVLASNGSKAASALPDEGLIADFPIELRDRVVSAEDDDPGGLTIEEICTWVAEHLYTEPAVVTGLSVSTSTAGVTLDWDKNPDPDVDIYQIFRADPDVEDSREHIASVFAPDTDIMDSENDPVYPMFNWDVGVPGKEYEYSVRAHNTAGYGGYSIVSGIRLMTAPTVDASDGAYNDHVHVEWTAVEGAESYAVLRGDTPEETPVELAQVDAETLSYNDFSGILEQLYYYWVQALGEDAEGPLGGPNAGFMIELDPVQVTATDGDYPDRVELVWGEEPLATLYYVYRGLDELDNTPELLGTVTPPEHAYTDYTAPWDTPRFYSVAPFVDDTLRPRGVGDWGHRGLAVPANVTATQGTFAGKVSVSWDAVNQATRYRVYRSVTADDPDPGYLNEVEAPTTSYEDTAANWGDTEGVHYFYFVTALHSGPDEERSPLSESAEGWRGIGTPASVSATDGTNTTGVNVSWDAVTQATHYRVYRSETEDDPAPTLLDTIPAPASGYSDMSTEHETLYWYSVSAVYNGDEGASSDDNSGYRGLAPPLNVQASDGNYEDQIEVTWDNVEGATGYTIYRSETETGTYTQIGTDTAGPYVDGPFTPPVSYWYKLKATNSLAQSAFSSADEGSVGLPEWHIVTVDSEGDVGFWSISHAVVSGNPAISYRDNTNGDLKYVRADDANGGSWGSPATIDSAGDVGFHTSLVIVNGNPAISYYDDTNKDLKYVRASDVNGGSWGTPVVVDSTEDVGEYESLWVVNGHPAISYHDRTNGDLKYVRATDASGSSWESPITIDSAGNVGIDTSLAIVNGKPSISYYDNTNGDLRYVRATDASGSSWESPVTIDGPGHVGRYTSLAIVNSKPAISYYDFDDRDLKYVRATDANGGSWGSPVTADSAGDVGRFTSLAMVNGNPAISYYYDTNDDLKYVRASDASGNTWGAPVTVDSVGDVGYSYKSLAVVSGNPAISYYDQTNGDLKYAIYY